MSNDKSPAAMPAGADEPKDTGAGASGLVIPPEFPKRLHARQFVLPAIAACVAVAMVPFTGRTWAVIDAALRVQPLHAVLRHLSVLGEEPAYIAAAVLIWWLDPRRRRAVVLMLLALLLAGGVSTVLKDTLRRARPDYGVAMSERQEEKNEDYLLQHPNSIVSPEEGDQWLLLSPTPPFFSPHFNSFPSGHSVTAFALCAFLAAVYPRARWLWFLAAVGCAASRVALRDHYVEDVIAGAALGWSVAWLAFAWPWLVRLSARVADVLDRKGRPPHHCGPS